MHVPSPNTLSLFILTSYCRREYVIQPQGWTQGPGASVTCLYVYNKHQVELTLGLIAIPPPPPQFRKSCLCMVTL